MCRVSVIIPAYNIEQYLPRCLDSVLQSKNRDLQVIVVDDGSTDSTGTICDDYACKDGRVTVVHKENGGVSSARNAAIPLIDSSWVCFVDGDDEVSPDFLTVDNPDADVIEKPYQVVSVEGEVDYCGVDWRKDYEQKHGFDRYFVNQRLNALWNKLIAARIVKGHSFDENFSNGEDQFFFIELIPQINNYVFSDLGTYSYCLRSSSATSQRSNKRELWKDYYFSCIDKLCSYDFETEICRAILFDIYVRNMYLVYDELPKDRKEKLIDQLKSMRWQDLKLLPFKRRLRLYWWHLMSLLK